MNSWSNNAMIAMVALSVVTGNYLGVQNGLRQGSTKCDEALVVSEELADAKAAAKTERFLHCVRRLDNAGFEPEHDPARLCEEMLGTP